MNNKNKEAKNILMVTAFPTYGAGSGVQVTALANSYLKEGRNWIVNPFLNNFYKDTFLYSIGVK